MTESSPADVKKGSAKGRKVQKTGNMLIRKTIFKTIFTSINI